MPNFAPVSPLLDPRGIDHLRTALADYTVDGVHEAIGLAGRSALARNDLTGVARLLDDRPVATLLRLFLLGTAVDEATAASALAPLSLEQASAAGLVERSAGQVRGLLDLRPYAEQPPGLDLGATGGRSWWVLSDFGSDVRPGPLAPDHVLGIGAAALTLAQSTVRRPVGTALDVGTGCGIQSLHLSEHAGTVTATDISDRALRLAATTAALNGLTWDLRQGSLLEPVAGEGFDLVVANPPFVVSPGWSAGDGGFDYRDSGLAGDGVSRELVQSLPGVLNPGGTAQLLANWIITGDRSWDERLTGWLSGRGCDAWIWQREVAEPGEYVALWLRDAGEQPGSQRWVRRYEHWRRWFDDAGVTAVGMGLITLRRTDSEPIVVCEDVAQQVEKPIGAHIDAAFGRRRWLAERSDDALLTARLTAADDLVLSTHAVAGPSGWQPRLRQLRMAHGLRWEVEIDDAVAALVAGCDGSAPLGELIAILASSVGAPAPEVADALAPVIRDLVGRGFLLPGQG